MSIPRDIARWGLETVCSMGVVGGALKSGSGSVTASVINNAEPISLIATYSNMGLLSVMAVDEKPKIVQVAFPFFSTLVAMPLLAAVGLVPMTSLMDTYLVCSTLLTGVALIKVIAKAIFKKSAEPKEESGPARAFNYVVTGAVTFIPCTMIEGLFGHEDWVFGLMGVLFGLAQVCITTLLGAPQESRTVHGFLPLVTSVLPFTVLRVMGGMNTSDAPFIFVAITTASILSALVGTVASRCLASKPPAPAQTGVVKEKKQEPAHNYRRGGSLPVNKSGGWENTGSGWKEKKVK